MTEEEVHRCMEVGVHPYYNNQAQVPGQRCNIQDEEHNKEQCCDLGEIGESQEDELCDLSNVSSFNHCLLDLSIGEEKQNTSLV